MDLKWFRVPKDIVFGDGTLEYLSTLEGKRAILVTGGSSMKRFGFLDQAKEYLEKAGMEVIIFDGVEPNPSVETVEAGAKAMLEFGPEWVVAIGGGSALDAAKIMWAFYEHPELKFEDIIEPGSLPKLRNKAKFVAIPSTSGTASEITAFSVITDVENHIKYPIVSYEITPDIAILDPQLPAKMPPHITANTGMDVLAHAIEAWVSTSATSYTDPIALEAIRLVFDKLSAAYENGGDMEARKDMHNASTLAGMAFTNASLGLVHSLAHKIGGEFGITHGLTNAILMPYIVQYNRTATDKVEKLEKLLGIEDLPHAIKELNKKLNIPLTFKEVTEVEIKEDKFLEVLERMSKNAFEDPCTLTNPRSSSPEDVAMIYKSAFYGEDIK
ncbi:MAG: iron-containing alcohol dehydrogenase [Anaeromicrobium sp.]|jgi:alcohol dehydrogenase class IV|uniref:iron-containing alcohol dehydrogenase n=1 Tax=Anaeromicrobium sp. TaxID=1929132 RepID=UPI0025EE2A3D|nr:iron-containing alcohol dehydrogenase [Anaeromicrobium sp.]MCT4596215.1 iron-containing alcohol dehydrogenase [Anaeromicrobium sp.]